MNVAAPEAVGLQTPRFRHVPAGVVSNFDAADAIELVGEAGMPLDDWQKLTLETWLGVRSDGFWAAQSAGIVLARQNGKNAVLEARELAGLFLFGEQRIIHSAHNANTAAEAFTRMRNLIEGVPWLDAEVAKILGSPGRQSIELKSGAKLTYSTRTKGGARGFSAPVVIFDEAQELTGEQIAAIIPVTSSFPNRQLIYTGTVLAGASVFRGLVERGRTGSDDALGYVEWSADEDCESDDVDAWLQANPSIGIRIELDYVRNELATFRAAGEEDKWRQERLSIWPTNDTVGSVVPVGAWLDCESKWRPDPGVTGGTVGLAISMDRDYAVVGYAVPSPHGTYVEAIAQTGDTVKDGTVRVGIDWVLPFLVGLQERRRPSTVVVDKAGPAASLLNALIGAGLPVKVTELADWKAACAQFVDAVSTRTVQHSGQVPVSEAAAGVRRRVIGDAWAYDRKSPGVRVAPLEAVTLAAWGLLPDPKAKQFFVTNLADYLND